MKKYLLAIGGILIISSNICSAMSAQQVKKDYESALTAAFFKTGDMAQVKKTFYNYAVDSTAINLCYKAAANVKSFVDSHSKNLVGTKDALLNNTAALLEKLTLDAINAIKITRGLVSSNSNLIQQFNIFDKLDIACYNASSTLGKESFTISDKKEAKDVLMFTLDFLRLLVRTARDAASIAGKPL